MFSDFWCRRLGNIHTGWEGGGRKRPAYQFWELNPLTIEIYTDSTMQQKLDYIYHNPVQEKWHISGKSRRLLLQFCHFL